MNENVVTDPHDEKESKPTLHGPPSHGSPKRHTFARATRKRRTDWVTLIGLLIVLLLIMASAAAAAVIVVETLRT